MTFSRLSEHFQYNQYKLQMCTTASFYTFLGFVAILCCFQQPEINRTLRFTGACDIVYSSAFVYKYKLHFGHPYLLPICKLNY